MNSRRIVSGISLLILGGLIGMQVRDLLKDPAIWPPDDFIEYWAAARLTLEGQNAYDPNLLLPLQRSAGRETDEAVMMWNPPWSLVVVLPLGSLAPRPAQLAWLMVNLLAIGYCVDRLWQLYGGRRETRWLGWLIAGTFLPTLFALHAGQIGPLLLLGAVLFLDAIKSHRPALAGAATVLLGIKPHLAYLLWLAILCEAIQTRKLRVILGGLFAGVFCTLVALAFNGNVLQQYLEAMTHRPPEQWVSPTLGTVLRLSLGEDRFALQFVPVLLGVMWFAWHWLWNRRTWDWQDQTPLLLLVSFTTAPYGAWPFDLVLLLPSIIQIVRRPDHPRRLLSRTLAITSLVTINLACLAMNLARTGSFWFLWVAPAILVVDVLSRWPRADGSRNESRVPESRV